MPPRTCVISAAMRILLLFANSVFLLGAVIFTAPFLLRQLSFS